jgi:regulator of sigma E protease
MIQSLAANISDLGHGVIGYLVPFLFVLSIVVFFHELGHFLVARRCGVKVIVFSLGFGPELAGFFDRHGTRWKISAIPLGGYVKFFGDDNAASVPDSSTLSAMDERDRRVSLFHKPVAARAAIVAAGPMANFLLAIVIFAGIFAIYGKQTAAARVDSVQASSAAAAAGFLPGDVIISIDGHGIGSFSDMQRMVATSAGKLLSIEIDRSGTRRVVQATPEQREVKDGFGNSHRIGVLGIMRSFAPEDVQTEKVGPLPAIWMGVEETWFVIDRTFSYLAGVIAGQQSADQLGGPIRIAQVSGQVAAAGVTALLHLAAVLSVSIGLLNLFPVPLLDGGHLLFYAIEAVRGRPLSERAQEFGFRIGLALVAMLMIFATYNDIRNLAPS